MQRDMAAVEPDEIATPGPRWPSPAAAGKHRAAARIQQDISKASPAAFCESSLSATQEC